MAELPGKKTTVAEDATQVGRNIQGLAEGLGGFEVPQIPNEEELEQELNDFMNARSQDEVDEFMRLRRRDKAKNTFMGLGKGLASALDFPGQAVSEVGNLFLNSLTLDSSGGTLGEFTGEIPSGGFNSLFEEAGMTLPDDEMPDTIETHMAKAMGEALVFGALAPFGAGIKLAETGASGFFGKSAQFVKSTLKSAGETAIKSPKSFFASELISAAGAGAGGFLLKEKFPDSPAAKFFGQVGGAVAVNVTLPRVLFRAASALNMKRREFFSADTALPRAIKRVKRDIVDPEQAIRNLDDPGVSGEFKKVASNVQLTGDPLFLEIEKAVIDAGDMISGVPAKDKALFKHMQRIGQMNDVIVRALDAPPSVIEPTRKVLLERNMYFEELINANIDRAMVVADRQLVKIGPKFTQQQASLIVHDTILDAEKALRKSEREIWNMVDLDGTDVIPDPMFNVWQDILSKRTEELSPSDLLFSGKDANALTKFLGKFVKRKKGGVNELLGIKAGDDVVFQPGEWSKRPITLRNVQNLRSRVLEEMRNVRAGGPGGSRKLALLDDVQEGLLHVMGAEELDTTTEAGINIAAALNYSRKVNQKMKSGFIGKMLKVDKNGSPIIPVTATLDKAFAGKPSIATTNYKKMIDAVKENPEELQSAAEEWVKSEFIRKTVRSGNVNKNAAERFISDNAEFLAEFPGLSKEFERAATTGSKAALKRKSGEQLVKKLQSPKMNKATLYIEHGPDNVFANLSNVQVMDSDTLNKEITILLNKVGKDDTGEALEGMRMSFLDWMKRQSTISADAATPQQVSALGDPFISGVKFRQLLNNPNVNAMAERILTGEQQNRLQQLLRETAILDQTRFASASKEGVVGDVPGIIRTVAAKVMGAKTGTTVAKATGTGGIQLQAIFSKLGIDRLRDAVKDPASKLLIDAITADDPALLKALLTEVADETSAKFVKRQMHAWLISSILEAGESYIGDIDFDIFSEEIDISENIGLKELQQ